MSESKLVKGLVVGAIVGAGVSMFDRATRQNMKHQLTNLSSDVKYYATNRDDLKSMLKEKLELLQTTYGQMSNDIEYLSTKFAEVKEMTPQVKTLVEDTKSAFMDSKEEYKQLVGKDEEFTMPVLPEHELDPSLSTYRQ
ncbi:YtxH domain-containing protein [Paenisporosarcina cavernae]|uniref:YtxH domain-containing protein n=1 Tax=Paenisporosarcina cavernae TaxID=2320858 RepID=A0A385YTN9_9BACL|nr:YtxH domain-containing protein [Paenisporosarcina cavernae]AYC30245.1 YtxH domain-containing protein [Paenisporosarcina cavernae]